MPTEFTFRPLDRSTWIKDGRQFYKSCRFRADHGKTMSLLRRELEALDVRSAVIELDLPENQIRNDGLPYQRANPSDPSVRISFQIPGIGPVQYPCNTFDDWRADGPVRRDPSPTAIHGKDTKAGSALYRRLRRTLLHEDIHGDARAEIVREWTPDAGPDLDRAYWYFVYSWIGRNGTAGTPNTNSGFCKRWTPHGGHGGQRFKSAIRSIPAWRRRMANLTITRMDGFEFLEKIEDCPGVAIYCDPPYLVKNAKYVHDFDDQDHDRLAQILARFTKARVVVSYYDHPRLAELYPNWNTREIEVTKATSCQNKRGANENKATEVLITNGPSYAAQAGRGLFVGT